MLSSATAAQAIGRSGDRVIAVIGKQDLVVRLPTQVSVISVHQ